VHTQDDEAYCHGTGLSLFVVGRDGTIYVGSECGVLAIDAATTASAPITNAPYRGWGLPASSAT
jgi:hypothetical protein